MRSRDYPSADGQHVGPAVKMPFDKAVQRIGRLVRPRVRSWNQENIQRLLVTFLRRRSADIVRDGDIDAQAYFCSAFVERVWAGLVDVEDLYGDRAGLERGGELG